MMIQAVLGNPNHPEYGVATIPFPIPHDQYAHCMELLEALEIGDAVKVDCKVEKIDSFYTVLKRTEMELDAFNDFAEAVEAMPSREKQIPKLKALLEHFEVTDLATAAGLAEHIGDYILTPEISSPQEAAIDELNFTMDVHSAELLLPHVNLFTYGNEIIKDDNAALTSYGLLHREDYQPMQTPVQETQEQAMTMA